MGGAGPFNFCKKIPTRGVEPLALWLKATRSTTELSRYDGVGGAGAFNFAKLRGEASAEAALRSLGYFSQFLHFPP